MGRGGVFQNVGYGEVRRCSVHVVSSETVTFRANESKKIRRMLFALLNTPTIHRTLQKTQDHGALHCVIHVTFPVEKGGRPFSLRDPTSNARNSVCPPPTSKRNDDNRKCILFNTVSSCLPLALK